MLSKILRKPQIDTDYIPIFHYPVSKWNYTAGFKVQFKPKENRPFKRLSVYTGLNIINHMTLHKYYKYNNSIPLKTYATVSTELYRNTFKRISSIKK